MRPIKIFFLFLLLSFYGINIAQIKNETDINISSQANEDDKIYILYINFFNDSYGTVFINNLPVAYRSIKDISGNKGSSSVQIHVEQYLVNGQNTIELIGNFPKYEIELYKSKSNQSPIKDHKIKFNENKGGDNLVRFEINDIKTHVWNNNEDFELADKKDLIDFALHLDAIIKNGNSKEYLTIQKTRYDLHLEEIKNTGLNQTFDDIKKDITQSFKSIKKRKKYWPQTVHLNEIKVHISDSKKLATVAHQNRNYLTSFKSTEGNFIWKWKTYYMKKEGKFVPVF